MVQARVSKKLPMTKGVIMLEPGVMPLPGGLVLVPTVVSVESWKKCCYHQKPGLGYCPKVIRWTVGPMVLHSDGFPEIMNKSLIELMEGKFSPDSALGNTPTLPGYTNELCHLQDADPFLKLLKQFWHARKKPSARERRGLP